PDDQFLVNELRHRGHMVRPVIWGADVAALRRFDRLVIRSPWDYTNSSELCDRFVSWLEALDQARVPMDNPPAVLTWLIHKQYLLDLEAVGASVVPTIYTDSGRHLKLADCFPGRPIVIKPAISASGKGLVYLESYSQAENFQEEFASLSQKKNYLVQPLLPEI